MTFPTVYLSRPSVVLPENRLHNEDVLRRLRDNYRGDPEQWPKIVAMVKRVFKACNSEHRYIEEDETVRVADYASRAAEACLEQNDVAAGKLDLLINGSVAREYFEPATAMEVCDKLGIQEIHAFDVTSACVGQLEAIQAACAYFSLHEHIDSALVCSAELTRQFLCYDIQSIQELVNKLAGLTIGNAASAWLLSREPFPRGGLRLLTMRTHSLPEHWHLCTAPIDGTFTSSAGELFKLSVHVAPELKRVLNHLGWAVDDVDHFVFHQPSDLMVGKVLSDLGADHRKAVFTHSLYANTASTTVSVAMDHLLRERSVAPGDRFILSSAASGFSMVTAAGEWER